jgi:hypothetical protein
MCPSCKSASTESWQQRVPNVFLTCKLAGCFLEVYMYPPPLPGGLHQRPMLWV